MKTTKLKYISTQLVSSKSRSAFREGAKRAMEANGYVVIVEEGWLVKKFPNGSIERLEELNLESDQPVSLD